MKSIFLLLLFSSLSFAVDIVIKEPLSINSPIKAKGYTGSDGKDGRDGDDGKCYYDSDTDSYSSDNGERGEDGEDGENGYDGDNVLIYYNNLSDLKRITIHAWGGSGGKGGKGGRGGDGCNGGRDGNSGNDGKDGWEGSDGSLYTIQSPKVWIGNVVQKNLIIQNLIEKEYQFRKNFWIKKSGAKKVVAADSWIKNTYYEFDKANIIDVKIDWNTPKQLERYKKIKTKISYDGEKIKVKFEGAVVDYSVSYNGNNAIISVENIYKRDELLSFVSFELTGQREGLLLTLKSTSPDLILSDVVFDIELYKKMFLSRNFLYFYGNSNINEYVEIEGNNIKIKVGQLPIKTRLIKRKKKIQINIEMNVKVFGQSMRKTYYLDHKVGSGVTSIY